MTAPAFDIPGYELTRELGAGGMATVFLAVQRSLDRKVAIKVMRRGLSDENVEKRFLIEGRTMARLPHPNIVGVYDIVQNESINYIAMEYLEGGMLSDKMRHGLTLAEAISVVVQIAGALQYAHDNGIVHRDLKPSNIMYRDAVTPVLTDFGIARQQNPETTRLTQTGMMIGTPTYMSPEQATGSDLDGRSDQYALGVLFFEMLTGHAPFEGSTPIQVVLAHLNTPPPPLPPQFAFFQPLMDRMLAKDRELRYPDLKVFVKELKALLTGNEALLHKLRGDPNQSASEQLRALGFSESQIHTGAGPAVSGRHAALPSPRTTGGGRIGDVHRTTGSGPGVRMGDDEPASGRPRWLLPAVIAGVLAVAGVGGWLALAPGKKELDPALQMLLNTNLQEVDRLIQEGKLITPADNNAFLRLQGVMQIALKEVKDYPEGEARLKAIAGKLTEQARTALQAKDYANAEARVGEALVVLPNDADALALQQAIAGARVQAERDQQVAALLQKAAQAQRGGQLVGEGSDNALGAIRAALDIDPGSAAAKQALLTLSEQILKPAQNAYDKGDLAAAEQALANSASYLAGEPAWMKLSALVDAKQQAQAQQQRIERLLTEARQRIGAGQIAEPLGASALDSLQRIVELDPQNATLAALRKQAADALVLQAKQAEAKGDAGLALSRYDQALQAAPGDAALAAARQALEQRVGERQTQISRGLSAARDAIAARNYYPPSKGNAQELLNGVLAIDASNGPARQLLADLPTLVREAAQSMATEGQLDAALALLKQAQAAHPGDAALGQLSARLSGEKASADRAALREQQLSTIRGLLARRQLNAEVARGVGTAVVELQKLDPADSEARSIRAQFLRGMTLALDAARTPAQLQPIDAALGELQRLWGTRADDLAAFAELSTLRRAEINRAEQERLAALMGTLVLNASPWAEVQSVVEQASGKTIELGSDRVTPLRLNLPAGSYRVTFKHPNVSRAVVQVATVEARGQQVASVSFPALSSREYLQRAGYAD